jgi:hypothetical protein
MFLPGTEIVADANIDEMGGQASQIKQMQNIIGVPQTGLFDAATSEALKTFQSDRGMAATGYPNDETIAALKQLGAGFGDLTWWDWAIIYAFEYKWWVLGAGAVALGGLGYWIWKKKRAK